jgi:hypothetical protein
VPTARNKQTPSQISRERTLFNKKKSPLVSLKILWRQTTATFFICTKQWMRGLDTLRRKTQIEQINE